MHLPSPVRAAVGLVASAATEAKHLPDRAIELPMLAVSTALQMSLRAQQRYARLAARGDDVLNRRAPTDEPPTWATFDDPVSVDEPVPVDGPVSTTGAATTGAATTGAATTGAATAGAATTGAATAGGTVVEGLFGVRDPGPAAEPGSAADHGSAAEPAGDAIPTAPVRKAAPATGTAPAKAPGEAAGKAPGKAAAGKAAPVKAAPVKAAAKRASTARKSPTPIDASRPAGSAAAASGGKTVNKPRHTAPSAFDEVADDSDATDG